MVLNSLHDRLGILVVQWRRGDRNDAGADAAPDAGFVACVSAVFDVIRQPMRELWPPRYVLDGPGTRSVRNVQRHPHGHRSSYGHCTGAAGSETCSAAPNGGAVGSERAGVARAAWNNLRVGFTAREERCRRNFIREGHGGGDWSPSEHRGPWRH